MRYCGKWPIGVCSWSLKNDLQSLNNLKLQTGIEYVHLSLNPALNGDEDYVSLVLDAGWKISAAMIGFRQEDYSSLESIKKTGGIVPDESWDDNRLHVVRAIDLAASFGIKYLEFHFGFIDNQNSMLIERVKYLADAAEKKNVTLLMETGQETAETLKEFLLKLAHPAVAVNFDPANMILYGKGNPVDAVKVLGRWIKHVHIKDAVASGIIGSWGCEVVWGSGEVQQKNFLKALNAIGYSGVLSIEREAGRSRLEDIVAAVGVLAE